MKPTVRYVLCPTCGKLMPDGRTGAPTHVEEHGRETTDAGSTPASSTIKQALPLPQGSGFYFDVKR